jgi:hypothetical protein
VELGEAVSLGRGRQVGARRSAAELLGQSTEFYLAYYRRRRVRLLQRIFANYIGATMAYGSPGGGVQQLSPQIVAVLQKLKVPRSKYAVASLNTCLVADLGIDGDNFDEFMHIIHHDFGVSLEGLDPRRYTLGEGDLLSPFGWIRRWLGADKKTFERLPLSVIEQALVDKRWPLL